MHTIDLTRKISRSGYIRYGIIKIFIFTAAQLSISSANVILRLYPTWKDTQPGEPRPLIESELWSTQFIGLNWCLWILQISSDLSLVDLDIAFSIQTAFGGTTYTFSALVILAVITWQVLFVSLPAVYMAILLQVSCSRMTPLLYFINIVHLFKQYYYRSSWLIFGIELITWWNIWTEILLCNCKGVDATQRYNQV